MSFKAYSRDPKKHFILDKRQSRGCRRNNSRSCCCQQRCREHGLCSFLPPSFGERSSSKRLPVLALLSCCRTARALRKRSRSGKINAVVSCKNVSDCPVQEECLWLPCQGLPLPGKNSTAIRLCGTGITTFLRFHHSHSDPCPSQDNRSACNCIGSRLFHIPPPTSCPPIHPFLPTKDGMTATPLIKRALAMDFPISKTRTTKYGTPSTGGVYLTTKTRTKIKLFYHKQTPFLFR